MKKVLGVAFAFIVVVLGLSGLILAGPMPAEVKFNLIFALTSTFLNIGVAVVLFMALGGFKHRLKVAYWYICASQLLLAAGIGQYPVIAILDAFESPWSKLGLDHLPFALACILGYVGFWTLAKLLAIKSWVLNPWIVLLISASLAGLALFIPMPHTDLPVTLLSLLEIIGMFLITVLVFQTKQQAGSLYTVALRWFFWGYMVYLGGNLLEFALLLLPADHPVVLLNIPIMLFPIGAIILLISAVSFNRIRFTEKLLAAAPVALNSPDAISATNSVDIVITVAQLASRPADTDIIMDNVRVITARSSGKATLLGPDEQTRLGQTYIQLEKFLVNDEPARKFDARDLRQMLDIRFRNVVNEPAFWKTIDNQPL